jgi:hypothetical protein
MSSIQSFCVSISAIVLLLGFFNPIHKMSDWYGRDSAVSVSDQRDAFDASSGSMVGPHRSRGGALSDAVSGHDCRHTKVAWSSRVKRLSFFRTQIVVPMHL